MYKCRQLVTDHPKENLAKFCYKPDIKSKYKYKDPSVFLVTYWNPSQKYGNWGFFFPPQNMANFDLLKNMKNPFE